MLKELIIRVTYSSYGFRFAELTGHHAAGNHVDFVGPGEGYKIIGVPDSGFMQYVEPASVVINDHTIKFVDDGPGYFRILL